MEYSTYEPQDDLAPLVNCYWTLEVPAAESAQKQLIIPDGMIEMAFILGDDVKRYTAGDDFILQPRAMVLGQISQPFYIEPAGYVNTFAVRFYPHGFCNLVNVPLSSLNNTETPVTSLFGNDSGGKLIAEITAASDTQQRIGIIERFLFKTLCSRPVIDQIVGSTVEVLASSKGTASITKIFKDDLSARRQMERKFTKQIGISPKQLGKIIRLQAALKILLNNEAGTLTAVAYESGYYDQTHFIKDFREFTGISPKEFLGSTTMALSSVFYK